MENETLRVGYTVHDICCVPSTATLATEGVKVIRLIQIVMDAVKLPSVVVTVIVDEPPPVAPWCCCGSLKKKTSCGGRKSERSLLLLPIFQFSFSFFQPP